MPDDFIRKGEHAGDKNGLLKTCKAIVPQNNM
jgi:hypothetical protein